MSYNPRIDARLMVLEREMPEVRKLASDASIEVGDVRAQYRAHNRVLEGLRKTQVETRDDIAKLDAKMGEGFAKMNVGMTLIAARLGIGEWDAGAS